MFAQLIPPIATRITVNRQFVEVRAESYIPGDILATSQGSAGISMGAPEFEFKPNFTFT